MRLLYRNDGFIMYAVYDRDWFLFQNETNYQLSVLEIDEVGDNNKAVCSDIVKTLHKWNSTGQKKYYIEDGELYARDGWVEATWPK